MKSIRSCVSRAALLALLAGCQAPQSPSNQPPVVSAGITFHETSKFFPQEREITNAEYPPRIDYQSDMRVGVDPSKLVPGTASVLPPLSPDEKAQLNALQAIVQAARIYLTTYQNSAAALEANLRLLQTPERVDASKKLIKVQGDAGAAFEHLLKDYVVKVIPDPVARRTQNTKFLPDGVVLDLNAVIAFIDAQSQPVIDQARQHAAALDANATKLRIRATIFQSGKTATPIHVENYDHTEDLNVVQEPRITTQMSADDRERIQKELAITKDVANLINDVQNKRLKIGDQLDSITTALRGDLKDWKDASGKLDTLVSKIDPVITALGATDGLPSLTDDVKVLKTDVANKLSLYKDFAASLKSIGDKPNSTDATEVLLNTADSAAKALTDAQAEWASVPDTLSKLDQIRAKVQSITPADTKITGLITAIAPDALKAISGAVADISGKYPALAGAIAKQVASGRVVAANLKLADIAVDPSLLDVDARFAKDGTIYVHRNVVTSGGTLRVDAALINPASAAAPGATPTSNSVASQDFQIEKFGLYNTWSTDLIFVNQFGKGSNANGDKFVAAPSLSWNLHFNPAPPLTGAPSSGDRFWRAINPGMGLNVAALNFDNGIEVGVGGHASLFNDLVMVGAGYDLNASKNHGYFYIGISLFEAFNRAGIGSFGR